MKWSGNVGDDHGERYTYLPAIIKSRESAFMSMVTRSSPGVSNHEKMSFSLGVFCMPLAKHMTKP